MSAGSDAGASLPDGDPGSVRVSSIAMMAHPTGIQDRGQDLPISMHGKTDELVKARLAEGVDSAAIVEELKDNDEHVEAVLAGYVNGFVHVERPQHHSFRLTRQFAD